MRNRKSQAFDTAAQEQDRRHLQKRPSQRSNRVVLESKTRASNSQAERQQEPKLSQAAQRPKLAAVMKSKTDARPEIRVENQCLIRRVEQKGEIYREALDNRPNTKLVTKILGDKTRKTRVGLGEIWRTGWKTRGRDRFPNTGDVRLRAPLVSEEIDEKRRLPASDSGTHMRDLAVRELRQQSTEGQRRKERSDLIASKTVTADHRQTLSHGNRLGVEPKTEDKEKTCCN
jgi:hypothetical protein